MKYITFGQDQDQVSQVILGTMNLVQLSAKDAEVFLKDALDSANGIVVAHLNEFFPLCNPFCQ